MEFHERVHALRKELKLKQVEIADLCGVNITTYHRWEKGTLEPNLTELRLLAHVLGLSVGELIGEETPPVSQGKVTIHHGDVTLDIPTTPEGLAFLEKKMAEFAARKKAQAQS